MNVTRKQAVRIFNRVWAPIQRAHDNGRQADAGFDSGEFSGPAHDEMEAIELTECCDRVAAQLGMTSDELWEALSEAEQYELDCYFNNGRICDDTNHLKARKAFGEG